MNSTATPETILMFLAQLDAEAEKSVPGSEWAFANGESFFLCTISAQRVAAAFGGRVVGFHCEDNPEAEIASGKDGHDFAIIAEQYIVDFWAAYAAGVVDRAVFDLSAPADRAIISRLYDRHLHPAEALRPHGAHPRLRQ